MRNYLDLWLSFFEGILNLLMGLINLLIALIAPCIWLILEILPWGVTCLFSGLRLKTGYKYLYIVPRFIKELTKPLRTRRNCQ